MVYSLAPSAENELRKSINNQLGEKLTIVELDVIPIYEVSNNGVNFEITPSAPKFRREP